MAQLSPEERIARRRASVARYNASAKRQAVNARYYASAKGQAARARGLTSINPLRLYIGYRYVGLADTAAKAAVLNAHIKDRLHVFIEGQSARAEAESVSSGTVSPPASPPTH